jgi:hypothetical protein
VKEGKKKKNKGVVGTDGAAEAFCLISCTVCSSVITARTRCCSCCSSPPPPAAVVVDPDAYWNFFSLLLALVLSLQLTFVPAAYWSFFFVFSFSLHMFCHCS